MDAILLDPTIKRLAGVCGSAFVDSLIWTKFYLLQIAPESEKLFAKLLKGVSVLAKAIENETVRSGFPVR